MIVFIINLLSWVCVCVSYHSVSWIISMCSFYDHVGSVVTSVVGVDSRSLLCTVHTPKVFEATVWILLSL